MFNLFALSLLGAVILIKADPQNVNSRNSQDKDGPVPFNSGPSQPPPDRDNLRQNYRDGDQNDVLNIGNGHDKHNFVIINENPRPVTVDRNFRNTGNNPPNSWQNSGGFGTVDQHVPLLNRFGNENTPPVNNLNPGPVNVPNARRNPGPVNIPNARRNPGPVNIPNARRATTVNNIGNGAGNQNWVVIQDTPSGGRTVSNIPINNFHIPNNYPNNNRHNLINTARTTFGSQNTNRQVSYTYNRIGHGPNNHNKVFINGKPAYDSESESHINQGEQIAFNSNCQCNNFKDDRLKVLPVKRTNNNFN